MKRNLEVLISALEKDPFKLAAHMNLECDAVIVDQTGRDHCFDFRTENGLTVKVMESCDRGVGKSRNMALDLADSKIVLLSDDDIVYKKVYNLLAKVCKNIRTAKRYGLFFNSD